jgi:CMP-N,N'-diacetyllegionaminic acid synthase
MIEKKSIIAIVPARGGSKGLPMKNIIPIQGKPLIEYTLCEAQKSKYIDKITISTDSIQIADIAENLGFPVSFMRPRELATDFAPSEDVIMNAIEYHEESGDCFDILLLLQPTSPLRTVEHIDQAISLFLDFPQATSLISVAKVRQYPHWMKVLSPDGWLKSFLGGQKRNTRRQDLPDLYYPNGAIYLATVEHFKKHQSFNTGYMLPYVMGEKYSFDIDGEIDAKIVEMIMRNNIQ